MKALEFNKRQALRVYAKERDTGRILELQCMEDSIPINLTGCIVSFNMTEPIVAFTNAEIFEAKEGIIRVPLSSDILSKSGVFKADISIFKSNGTFWTSTTFELDIDVSQRDDDAIEAGDDMSVLKGIVLDLDNLKQTFTPDLYQVRLSLEGKANKSEIGSPLIAASVAAMTDISKVYVNLTDGKWYSWNNSYWEPGGVYQSTGIADGSIDYQKTAFFGTGKNMFNKHTVTAEFGINGNSGVLFALAGHSASDYIIVSPSTTYTRSYAHSIAYYNSDRVFISGSTSVGAVNTITTPENCKYVRLTVINTSVDTMQFELGSASTEYDSFYNQLKEVARIKKKSILDFSVDAGETSFLKPTTGKNLFNKRTVSTNSGVNGTSGVIISLTGYSASDYIAVSPEITYTRNYKHAIAFYDSSKVFISGKISSEASLTFVTPANCKYIRVTISTGILDTFQIEKGGSQTSYEEYMTKYEFDSNKLVVDTNGVQNLLYDKKLIFNGDSIPAGWVDTSLPGYTELVKSYPQIAADSLKMTLMNTSIGGCTIGVWGNEGTEPKDRNPIILRYESMPDGDIIVIAGGTNDWVYNWAPLGVFSDRVNTTFYGALHNLCLGLLNKYLGKQLLFLTPIKRSQISGGVNAVNGAGKKLTDYCNAIKEVCAYYSIPVLDMQNENMLTPHVDFIKAAFLPDGTHPNKAGHEIMARRVSGYIKQLL